MANLTVSVDDEIIKRARVRAIQQGTSVSAKVREFLEHYVNESEDLRKKQRVDDTALLMQAIETASAQTQPDTASAVSGEKRRRTLRDEIYKGDFRARDRNAAKAG